MGNLLSRIYDFFAFALPGACLIIIVLLFPFGNDIVKYYDLPWNGIGIINKLIIIAIAGYLAGYILTPLARSAILLKIAIPLSRFIDLKFNSKNELKKKYFKNEYKLLVVSLKSRNLSRRFNYIRNKRANSAQYIEFWDMHVTMSINLAFCSLVLFLFQLLSLLLPTEGIAFQPVIILLIATASFFLLIKIAVKYSFWWMHDIIAASKKRI